ncbi:hypothetical protein CASFOL_017522 [Castilleja foliolosa]|uniref:Uncharacterized protein n=1 Tax=Castilleja foliolosa TaxID=1961234 RepID=A0ABD3DB92_9LAMI
MSTIKYSNASFKDIEPKKFIFSSPTAIAKPSVHFSNHKYELGSLSMNGCGGDPRAPIGTVETRTLPVSPTPALATDRLNSAIFNLKSIAPQADSGIIRIEDSILRI